MTAYQVRFAAGSNLSTKQLPQDGRKLRSKSKFGCKECKLRRVKCDETYPVCLQCQRRGSLRLSATPPRQWQAVTPWMIPRPVKEPWTGVFNRNKRLMHYWFENTSRMMTVSPDNNPLSPPLLEHLLSTPSLVHAVQSVNAGQEIFFQRSTLQTCLGERGLAIQALQRELQDPSQIKPPSLISVFLLGISWSWTEDRPHCYGKEHLSGAHALLDKMLADEQKREEPLVQYILGWYIYWDLSCAFIADPDDFYPLNTAGMLAAVKIMRASFHPMIGFSAELFYLLASLGRYCRQTMKTGVRDLALEATFKEQLIAWKPTHDDKMLVDMSYAYRNHGLIMLYEVCERFYVPENSMECWKQSRDYAQTTRSLTRRLALDSLKRLFETPVNAPCIVTECWPLR
ncbi:hypothetical protein K469DRAFT_724446 [Zopfia rhizophila CBS 207.26]|uniref:Zn(2)-C6 fungal-type domain-containing protein n=1 Tax=Zopfia rhizophila CBS 207.26 TaxID=1314779 RepID=A0A6A6ECD1_9PEZI|nr:hypothetical protein K469DRAFT_724446 [Zopfia rhizophila CBS 207.26]